MGICLKEHRQQAGLTQKQLAQHSGVSLAEIRALEQGKQEELSTKTALALAEAMGMEAEQLFFPASVKHVKQREERFTPKTLQRRVEGYFNAITYTVTATREVPTQEVDSKGHPIYEVRPCRNDAGEEITYRVFAVPPTIGGLCRFAGIFRDTWNELCQQEEFRRVTRWAISEILAYHEEQLLVRKDVRGILFNLQNGFGMSPAPEEGEETPALSLEEKMALLQQLSGSYEAEED